MEVNYAITPLLKQNVDIAFDLRPAAPAPLAIRGNWAGRGAEDLEEGHYGSEPLEHRGNPRYVIIDPRLFRA